jgi:hypothetical protein
MVRVIKMADDSPATENRFEADVKHIPLKLEPGAAYRVCIDSVMFHHEECQVRILFLPHYLTCCAVYKYCFTQLYTMYKTQIFVVDDKTDAGGHKEMSSILDDQMWGVGGLRGLSQ